MLASNVFVPFSTPMIAVTEICPLLPVMPLAADNDPPPVVAAKLTVAPATGWLLPSRASKVSVRDVPTCALEGGVPITTMAVAVFGATFAVNDSGDPSSPVDDAVKRL